MNKLILRGGRPLHGEVEVGGFKNAALPVLFATVLVADVSVIDNLPMIRDVLQTLEILRAMGAVITHSAPHTVMLDTRNMTPGQAPDALVSSFRASSYLLGAELGRFGRARAALPGGCRIGARPLDLHVLALTALGANVTLGGGAITATASHLAGGRICFPTPSVGATVNAILAAVKADGVTEIVGAAREPHIEDLCRFLNAAGAEIVGAGEGRLRVRGVSRLRGIHHRLMPDMIEAGTLLTAVGAAGGEIAIRGCDHRHLGALLSVLRSMGMILRREGELLVAARREKLAPCTVVAEPYPGFPTDMHPQLAALATLADGVSTIRDSVFPDRFAYADELKRMGGALAVADGGVTVSPSRLHGGRVTAVDLRAGAALAVAALAADGRTLIRGADILERGYERFPEKLKSLGACVDFS